MAGVQSIGSFKKIKPDLALKFDLVQIHLSYEQEDGPGIKVQDI